MNKRLFSETCHWLKQYFQTERSYIGFKLTLNWYCLYPFHPSGKQWRIHGKVFSAWFKPLFWPLTPSPLWSQNAAGRHVRPKINNSPFTTAPSPLHAAFTTNSSVSFSTLFSQNAFSPVIQLEINNCVCGCVCVFDAGVQYVLPLCFILQAELR